MKLNVKDKTRPALKPGQIWERDGQYYLAVRTSGVGTHTISLVSLPGCSVTWAGNSGFRGDDAQFTFVDILEIE